MATQFIPVNCDTDFLFQPSVQEWLPAGHLASCVVDVVNQLDPSRLESAYAGLVSEWCLCDPAFGEDISGAAVCVL